MVGLLAEIASAEGRLVYGRGWKVCSSFPTLKGAGMRDLTPFPAIDEMCASECCLHSAGPQPLRGPEQ